MRNFFFYIYMQINEIGTKEKYKVSKHGKKNTITLNSIYRMKSFYRVCLITFSLHVWRHATHTCSVQCVHSTTPCDGLLRLTQCMER